MLLQPTFKARCNHQQLATEKLTVEVINAGNTAELIANNNNTFLTLQDQFLHAQNGKTAQALTMERKSWLAPVFPALRDKLLI